MAIVIFVYQIVFATLTVIWFNKPCIIDLFEIPIERTENDYSCLLLFSPISAVQMSGKIN